MINQYNFWGNVNMFIYYLKTKSFYPDCRLIRFPFDIRNRKLIQLGKGLTTGYGCRLEAHDVFMNNKIKLYFGNNVQINDYVHIAAGEFVSIGNNVLIASKVFISDISHGNYNGENQDPPDSISKDRKLITKPVIIEDNVWIGENVGVLPGVTIGKSSIIGANSLVSKSIPQNVIAVGNPIKVIKEYNFESNKWEKI